MLARIPRPAVLAALVALAGCDRSGAGGRGGPVDFPRTTGDPTFDYWVAVNREVGHLRKRSGDSMTEMLSCQLIAKTLRGYPTAGVDADLAAWAEKLAYWYDIRADILKIRNTSDFYRKGIEDARAGRRPTIVEENQQLMAEWDEKFRAVREEGIQLRGRLGATYRKAFPPCEFDSPG